MEARDLYLKIEPKDGSPATVRLHRVWDADRFLASITKQEAKEGNNVVAATRADYMQQRKG